MSDDKRRYELPGIGDMNAVERAWATRDAGIVDPHAFAKCCDALEYVVRSPRKGGIGDLRKAIDCLTEACDRLRELTGQRPERVSDLRGVEERVRSAATAADGVLRIPTDWIEQGTR